MNYELLNTAERELAELRRVYDLGSGDYHADLYGEQVTYRNLHAAIRIRLDYRNARLFLSLFRLADEPLPTYWDIDARLRDPLNGFDLDDLIALRAPARSIKYPAKVPLTPADVQHVLREYATILPSVADDVLRGDFSVFRDLAAVVAQRIETFAQKGNVLGPDSQSFLATYRKLEQQ